MFGAVAKIIYALAKIIYVVAKIIYLKKSSLVSFS